VRRLVVTHLSERYPGPEQHLAEATAAAGPDVDVVVAEDLDRIPLPPRR
jgi:ribonuclease Z